MTTSSTVIATSPQSPGKNWLLPKTTFNQSKPPSPSPKLDTGAAPLLASNLPGLSKQSQRLGTLWQSRVTTSWLPTQLFANPQFLQLISMGQRKNSLYLSPHGPLAVMTMCSRFKTPQQEISAPTSQSTLIPWAVPQKFSQPNPFLTSLCAMFLTSTGKTRASNTVRKTQTPPFCP